MSWQAIPVLSLSLSLSLSLLCWTLEARIHFLSVVFYWSQPSVVREQDSFFQQEKPHTSTHIYQLCRKCLMHPSLSNNTIQAFWAKTIPWNISFVQTPHFQLSFLYWPCLLHMQPTRPKFHFLLDGLSIQVLVAPYLQTITICILFLLLFMNISTWHAFGSLFYIAPFAY